MINAIFLPLSPALHSSHFTIWYCHSSDSHIDCIVIKFNREKNNNKYIYKSNRKWMFTFDWFECTRTYFHTHTHTRNAIFIILAFDWMLWLFVCLMQEKLLIQNKSITLAFWWANNGISNQMLRTKIKNREKRNFSYFRCGSLFYYRESATPRLTSSCTRQWNIKW